MNPSDVAPLIGSIFLITVSAAVILLRPIFKRLGIYLEVLAEERRRNLNQSPAERIDLARLTSTLDALDQRLSRIEDRQEFTDKLLAERNPAHLHKG